MHVPVRVASPAGRLDGVAFFDEMRCAQAEVRGGRGLELARAEGLPLAPLSKHDPDEARFATRECWRRAATFPALSTLSTLPLTMRLSKCIDPR